MNKRNIKLIMELIFIFILPLVFICFTSEIQVEREFEVINTENLATNETKSITFNNSIIKYTKQVERVSLQHEEINEEGTLNINGVWYFPQLDRQEDYFYGEDFDGNMFNIRTLGSTPNQENYLLIQEGNNINYIPPIVEINFDNTIYIGYDLSSINQIIDVSNYLAFDNDGYWIGITSTETVNTIWSNIKNLLITNLELNDNVLLDLIICYTILWIIMFIIWHILYGFFELIIHILPKKWERD